MTTKNGRRRPNFDTKNADSGNNDTNTITSKCFNGSNTETRAGQRQDNISTNVFRMANSEEKKMVSSSHTINTEQLSAKRYKFTPNKKKQYDTTQRKPVQE